MFEQIILHSQLRFYFIKQRYKNFGFLCCSFFFTCGPLFSFFTGRVLLLFLWFLVSSGSTFCCSVKIFEIKFSGIASQAALLCFVVTIFVMTTYRMFALNLKSVD